MVNVQGERYFIVTSPTALKDNASWTTNEIDTVVNGVKYDYLTIIWFLGANDIAMTALKLQESDTSGSGFADITGLVFGTSNNIAGSASTLPSATDDDKIFVMEVDLRKRKRYLDLVATNGDGTVGGYGACVAILSRAKQMPNTTTERGASQILRV